MPRARSFGFAVAILAAGLAAPSLLAQESAGDDAGYRTATGLLHRGLPEQAAAEYRAFLRDHPGHADAANARYGLAVCLTRLNQWREAAAELDALGRVKDFEFAPDALMLRAQCAAATQDHAPAIASLRTLLDNYPAFERSDAAAGLLGESLYRQGKPADAAEVLGRFAKEWPQSASRPRAEFILVLCEAQLGHDREAASRLAAFRAQWPKDELQPQVALTEAQCRHRMAMSVSGQPDKVQIERALALYKSAADSGQEPLIPAAQLGTAQLLRSSGKPDQAGQVLDDLLKRFPTCPVADAARVERGRAFLDADQPERALALLAPVADADKSASAAEAACWAARCEVRLERYDAAAQRLAAAIQSHAQSGLIPEMLYDRALALGRAGRSDEARAAFAQMRGKFPRHALAAEALAAEASLALGAGDGKDATTLCREFLDKYADHPRAAALRLVLADAELADGHADLAEREYAAFVDSHGNDPQARSAALRRGLALARLGKTDEAGPILVRALKAPGPADPALIRAASIVAADAAMARSDWTGAEQSLRDLTASPDGRTSDALLKLGLCLQRQGRSPEALAVLTEVARDPTFGPAVIQAQFERGQILAEQGKLDDARSSFEQVIAAEADAKEPRFTAHALRHLAAIASRQGDPARAAELLGRVAQSQGNGSADALYDQGVALLGAGKYQDAEEILARFVRQAPEHARTPDARARQAIARSRRGDYDGALGLIAAAEPAAGAMSADTRAAMGYEKAWALKELHRADDAKAAYARLLAGPVPPSLQAHAALDLAQLEVGADNYAGALDLLKRAAAAAEQVQGEDAAAITERAAYLRGVCEFKSGHADQAAATLDGFLKQYPRSDLAIAAGLLAGQAYLKNNHAEEAAARLTRVVDASPQAQTLAPALLFLGEALAASQRWEQSQAALERYLKEFGDSEFAFQARFGIAWALENRGRHAEAIAAYRDVVDHHKGPTAARAQFQIGECLFAQKQYDQAVRELLKVDILYAYPEWSAAALYEAGRCLAQLNKVAEARQQYAQVTERFKDTDWARLASKQLKDTTPTPLPGAAAHSPDTP